MPDWFPTWLITLAQILQMVVGVFVAFNYYRVLSAGGSCAVSTDLLWACAVMYSTYLYLFVEFAVKRYVRAWLLGVFVGWLLARGPSDIGVCVSIQPKVLPYPRHGHPHPTTATSSSPSRTRGTRASR